MVFGENRLFDRERGTTSCLALLLRVPVLKRVCVHLTVWMQMMVRVYMRTMLVIMIVHMWMHMIVTHMIVTVVMSMAVGIIHACHFDYDDIVAA